MGPQNAELGDLTGIELPEAPVDETALNELKHKAKYARSKEFKELREKAQVRIDFYKNFLPDGTPAATANKEARAQAWGTANLIIAELEQLFGEHENAEAILKEEFGE